MAKYIKNKKIHPNPIILRNSKVLVKLSRNLFLPSIIQDRIFFLLIITIILLGKKYHSNTPQKLTLSKVKRKGRKKIIN